MEGTKKYEHFFFFEFFRNILIDIDGEGKEIKNIRYSKFHLKDLELIFEPIKEKESKYDFTWHSGFKSRRNLRELKYPEIFDIFLRVFSFKISALDTLSEFKDFWNYHFKFSGKEKEEFLYFLLFCIEHSIEQHFEYGESHHLLVSPKIIYERKKVLETFKKNILSIVGKEDNTTVSVKKDFTLKQRIILLNEIGFFDSDYIKKLSTQKKGKLVAAILSNNPKNTEDSIRYMNGNNGKNPIDPYSHKEYVETIRHFLKEYN
jgi:hypothetical protein